MYEVCIQSIFAIVLKVKISIWRFLWENRGAVHVREDILDMLKSQCGKATNLGNVY